MIQMNFCIKQKQIHRHRKHTYGYQRGEGWGGINQEFGINRHCAVLCLVVQSCLTLCNPVDYSPPGPSVHGASPGKKTRVGCHALLQGIFPIQGSNSSLLCLLHWEAGSLPLAPPGIVHMNAKKVIKTRTRNQWTETFLEVTRECSQRRELQFNKALPDIEEVRNVGEEETRSQEEDFTEERRKI